MAFAFNTKMKTTRQQRDGPEGGAWIDLLFLPSAAVCMIVLMRWVAFPIAVTASIVMNLLIFALFEPRKGGLKRFVLAILGGGLVTFLLAVILHWGFGYLRK